MLEHEVKTKVLNIGPVRDRLFIMPIPSRNKS